MFLWNSLAFLMIQRMLAIWPLVRLPFRKPAWTSGSLWFMYCWTLAWRILSITLLACEMSAYAEIWGLLTAWAVLQALAPGKAHNLILRGKVWCGHQPHLTLHTGKLMHRGIDISVELAWSHAWMPESVPLNPALPLSPHPMAPQHPRRVRGSPQCPRGALGWRGSPWAGALLPWLCDSAHLSFPSPGF